MMVGAALTGCSSMMSSGPSTTTTAAVDTTQPSELPDASTLGSSQIGGKYEQSMDEIDKTKLSRALDAGLGKSTTWKNASTGLTYTVVPTRKVTVNGNAFCRQYSITVGRSEQQSNTLNGTACVASDGAWHIAG